ncbi:MAG: FixH family protein [Oceanicoccus sp.]
MQIVEDILPWYKQFWPWFIIALPASVVVAGLITVYIAFDNADSLVVDDYYKQGLGINRTLHQDAVATKLGIKAGVTIDSLVGEVRIILQGNFAEQPRTLLLQWIHPTSKDRDFSLELNRTPNNDYLGQLITSVDGRWYVQLSADSPEAWRLKNEVSGLIGAGDSLVRFDFLHAVGK